MKRKMNQYDYEIRQIDTLIPYARNSRTHSDAQVESSSRKQIWSRLSGFLLLVRHLLRF